MAVSADPILENHLYERNFFEHGLPGVAREIPHDDVIPATLKEICSRTHQRGNETQLEDKVIAAVMCRQQE